MGPSYPGVLISGHTPRARAREEATHRDRETCDDLVLKKEYKIY